MQTNNKLREALKDIGRLVEQIHFLYSDYPSEIHEIARKVNAALAEPVKNCDVGVPEERIQRWSKFCKARSKKLPPIHGFEWEDYPYEEGGNDGK